MSVRHHENEQYFSRGANKTYFQVGCKANLLAHPDEPLAGIVLIPFVTISVIRRELVVEVMVSFSHRDHGGECAVPGC